MSIDMQSELVVLRRAILEMAAGVEQRVCRAIEALLHHDLEGALVVRSGDAEIDRMEVDIEAECLRILALGHPVASDLRFVLGVMRINTDLERGGDIAKGLAKRVIDLGHTSPVEPPEMLREMARAAVAMFRDAVAALADHDAALARRIRPADDRVDDLQKEVFTWAQEEIPRNVGATRAVIDLLSVARKLERIGDLATNIAENVVFLTEGAVIRHTAPGTQTV